MVEANGGEKIKTFYPYQKIALHIGCKSYDKLREHERFDGTNDLDSVL